MMNTPIFDFLNNYDKSGTLRLHMPGHKGCTQFLPLSAAYDITEIKDADFLFYPEGSHDGIIAQSEKNASSLYNSGRTIYSAGGSTLCIQTMLALVRERGGKILAVRNSHRAFVNACALLGIEVDWVENDLNVFNESDICPQIAEALGSSAYSAVYITSPDYFGRLADIAGISAVCKKSGALLLVDNAHGAHLAFLPENLHPLYLGADICCDSAHKTLPALTGAAFLHFADSELAFGAKEKMSVFGSTSPSYPILASLDLCCAYLDTSARADLARVCGFAAEQKRVFPDGFVMDTEPLHFTLCPHAAGKSGLMLADELRKLGAEPEYADENTVVLLLSPVMTDEKLLHLEEILSSLAVGGGKTEPRRAPHFEASERVMSMNEALFARRELVSVEESEGRISACCVAPCPPGILLLAPGEIISAKTVDILKFYGTVELFVVK